MALILAKYKAALLAGALVASAGAGWVGNGWRMGKKLEAQKATFYQAKGRRAEDYANALVAGARAANAAVAESQAILAKARGEAKRLVAEATAKAPTTGEFACRQEALPEDYLEVFRQ